MLPQQTAPAPLTGRLTDVALGCQRVLEQNPTHPQALVGICLVALASRQPQAAVKMALAAVSTAPAMSVAWIALGQALKAVGDTAEAERAYQRAIRLDGMDPLARMGLGELKLAAGRAEEAATDFEFALCRNPALVAAHLGLGNALALMGRLADALERYEKALSFRPGLAEAQFAAGFALQRLGRPKEAERRYRRALVLRPDFAAAWMNLGSILREQGSEAFAEAALLRAIELRPDLIAGWINLAVLKREQKRPEQAEAHLRKAFALNPNQVETLISWCQFRAGEGDPAGAWEWLRWALVRDPENAEAFNMQGILLHNDGRFAEAVSAFERAEAMGSRAAISNRGNSLLDMGRTAQALQAHEHAVASEPSSAGAAYNLALTQLRLGLWMPGWPAYEARWHFREVHRRPRVFTQPRWRGEPLNGRRILLHSEQGLGDTIQFCRYAALVGARGGFPVLQVQPAAVRLLHSLAIVRAGLAEIAELGTKPPAFDVECPLLSLPAVFATTVDSVPWSGAYLGADSVPIREKRSQYPTVRPGSLRVGIAWAGNPRYKADHQRSMCLKTLTPLLRTRSITWISLQKGPSAAQLESLPGDIFVWDGSSCDQDLAETASLLATLDLVITTDTSIAHLAGAMGKPVWILLPHLADWRWMQRIETSPWYPTAVLFRQSAPGDWASVLSRVGSALDAMRERSFRPASLHSKKGSLQLARGRA